MAPNRDIDKSFLLFFFSSNLFDGIDHSSESIDRDIRSDGITRT